MITVKSSLTGQVLFTADLAEGELRLGPAEARELLEFLGRGPLHKAVNVSIGPKGQPRRASVVMGGAAADHPLVAMDGPKRQDTSFGFLNNLN